jgi:hypothetical protein
MSITPTCYPPKSNKFFKYKTLYQKQNASTQHSIREIRVIEIDSDRLTVVSGNTLKTSHIIELARETPIFDRIGVFGVGPTPLKRGATWAM